LQYSVITSGEFKQQVPLDYANILVNTGYSLFLSKHIRHVSGRISHALGERSLVLVTYVDITAHTYIRSWTLMEILREKDMVFLRIHVLYLPSVVRFPYTAQFRPWHDCQAKPCGGACAM